MFTAFLVFWPAGLFLGTREELLKYRLQHGCVCMFGQLVVLHFLNTNALIWCFAEHTVPRGDTGWTAQCAFTDVVSGVYILQLWVCDCVCVSSAWVDAGNVLVVLLCLFNCHFYIQYESTGHLVWSDTLYMTHIIRIIMTNILLRFVSVLFSIQALPCFFFFS